MSSAGTRDGPAGEAHHYAFYGLEWHANVPLPGMSTTQPGAAPATCVRLHARPLGYDAGTHYKLIHERVDSADEALRLYRHSARPSYLYCYADGTHFHVDGAARRIDGGWPAHLSLDNASTYLLGPVAGLCARLAGFSCLHASVVASGGKAVAFTGAAGAGKSTTAAALCQRGYRVLSDDIAVLRPATPDVHACFDVLPGLPRLNLWPGSARAIVRDEDLPALVPDHPYFDKRYLPVRAERVGTAPAPLRAVYCGRVEAVHTPRIRALRAAQAAAVLASNAYAPYVLDAGSRARDFDVWTRLAATVPVREVVFRADLSALDELIDAIAADIESLAASAA